MGRRSYIEKSFLKPMQHLKMPVLCIVCDGDRACESGLRCPLRLTPLGLRRWAKDERYFAEQASKPGGASRWRRWIIQTVSMPHLKATAFKIGEERPI